MANKIRAKLVMQLKAAGLSANKIYETHHISKKSQREVMDRAASLGVSYGDVEAMQDDEVYRLLFPERHNHESVFAQPDWDHVHKELARVGVTLQLLHEEYRKDCAEQGMAAMGYDRFCKGYRNFTVAKNYTSRVGHKAARIVEVDWSGPTLQLYGPDLEKTVKVYLFVATLPFSRYSYVEPTLDMKQDTWLRCHIHMFEFFGGSVPIVVPDNLATGVKHHPREGEVVLNDAYERLCAHYGCAVMAARVASAKDKPSVEGTVGNIATAVIARLRDIRFTNFDALKLAVAEKLSAYNDAPFQKRVEPSRTACFLEEEKPLLNPLPKVAYEIATWVYDRKVQLNGHVSYKRNFYSCPAVYVGRKVDLRITDATIEIFLGGERIASHPLFPDYAKNRYSTRASDVPKDHSFSDWDSARIRAWAKRIGASCSEVIDRIFCSVEFEEQGYNAALAVLRLSNKYGRERLEKAACMALDTGVRSPRYAHLEPILKTNQDKALRADDDPTGYVRGAGFYGGGR